MPKRTLGVALLMLALTGCGSAASHAGPSAQQMAHKKAAQKAHAAQLKTWQTCQRDLGPFARKLRTLNSRLDVGLTQSEYNLALGNAHATYDSTITPKLHEIQSSPTCLQNGADLEDAFNAYIAANTYWSHCIQNEWCTVDEATLQKHWTVASGKLDDYASGLAAMKP